MFFSSQYFIFKYRIALYKIQITKTPGGYLKSIESLCKYIVINFFFIQWNKKIQSDYKISNT